MADYQLSYTGDQVNTAIGQIVDKNITGTLTVETLALANPLAITQGGTGKDNRIDAFSNLADYGSVTGSATNDIPGVWGDKGSGVHSFTSDSGSGGASIEGLVSGSIIHNWVTYRSLGGSFSPDAVTQFRITNTGQCYTRFGYTRQTVWSTPWTRLLTISDGIQIVKLWENASPTSAFAPQDVTITTVNVGDLIGIEFESKSGESDRRITWLSVKAGATTEIVTVQSTSDGGNVFVTRRGVTIVSHTQVHFDLGYYRYVGSTNYRDDNYSVPTAIYVAKGVV
mgnify:CR=1 FL=1